MSSRLRAASRVCMPPYGNTGAESLRSKRVGSLGPSPFFHPVKGFVMNNIVYIVGAVVIILAVLSFVGLR